MGDVSLGGGFGINEVIRITESAPEIKDEKAVGWQISIFNTSPDGSAHATVYSICADITPDMPPQLKQLPIVP